MVGCGCKWLMLGKKECDLNLIHCLSEQNLTQLSGFIFEER